ncbi:MAG: molybdenum hydroxylase, partial [Pelotomaculum sp.]|nr:molybdenum hydroxylase [Pelotomaculum sp.]
GRPGNVGGYTVERLLRAPAEGIIRTVKSIGDIVEKGETVAFVNDAPVVAEISGVIKGMIRDGVEVKKSMKVGYIDSRNNFRCDAISDKALAVGDGVLEAVVNFFMTPEKPISYIWQQ